MNDFEKDFFKLMNSSVFGKMMENIRKHRDINLVTNEVAYLKRLMKLNFKSKSLVKPDGVQDEEDPSYHEQTTYLGQAILNLSKIIMYEFHWNYMKPKYGNQSLVVLHGH